MTFRRNRNAELDQSYLGLQADLIFDSVPPTNSADQNLVGKQLRGSTITTPGTYVAYASIAGMSGIDILLASTINSGSATVKAETEYLDGTVKATVLATTAVAATNTASANALRGEQRLRVTIVLGAASSITFTRAEVDGSSSASANVSGSAATLGGQTANGAQVVTRPGEWGQGHTPAAATQATTSKAAVASARHVCTSIAATLSTGATAQATAAVLVLRDGATGAGTILWTKQVILPVNGVWDVNLTGLNLIGSVNTAMTLEFTGAGVAGSFESVSMGGYDVS